MNNLPVLPEISLPPGLAEISPEDVERKLREFVRDKEAFASNTLSGFAYAVGIFAKYCQSRNVPWFPVNDEIARDYFIWLKDDLDRSVATVNTHYAMLNMLHAQAGLPTLATSNVVTLALKKIRRTAALNGERAGQALPLHLADLKQVDRVLSESGRLADLRNRAFLFVAYNTLLRISEISRLRVRDVTVKGDTVTLYIGFTKTNTVTGTVKKLSMVATRILQAWLSESGLASQPDAMLFSGVKKNNKATVADAPLTKAVMERIFRDAYTLLDREPAEGNKGRYTTWTGHSARVGAALDMLDSGSTMEQIMAEGNWKNVNTVMRYVRNSGSIRSHMSDLMDQ